MQIPSKFQDNSSQKQKEQFLISNKQKQYTQNIINNKRTFGGIIVTDIKVFSKIKYLYQVFPTACPLERPYHYPESFKFLFPFSSERMEARWVSPNSGVSSLCKVRQNFSHCNQTRQTVLRNRYHSQAITLGKASGPLKDFFSLFCLYFTGISFIFFFHSNV